MFYIVAKWFEKSGFVITFTMFCALTISYVSYMVAGETSKVFTTGLKCYTVNHGSKHHRSHTQKTDKLNQANKTSLSSLC